MFIYFSFFSDHVYMLFAHAMGMTEKINMFPEGNLLYIWNFFLLGTFRYSMNVQSRGGPVGGELDDR